MRYKKLFSAVALATILSLLAIGLAASPVMAAENITLDPDEGEIGDPIDIDGEEFNETDTVDGVTHNKDVSIYFTSEEVEIGDDIDYVDAYDILDYTQSVDDSDDDFSSNDRPVPSELDEPDLDEDEIEEVVGGIYYVFVTYKGEDDIQAVAEFTVIAGEIDLDPDSDIVGSEVEITGSYFQGSDDITVTFGDDSVDIERGDTYTDSGGDFEDTVIIIPDAAAGDHTIAVTDEHEHTAEATFTVESALSVSPSDGSIGSTVTASGTGFDARQVVTVTFNDVQVKTVSTDSDGSFTATFTVPEVEAGTYDIEADDGDNSATVAFTMSSSISLGTSTTLDSPGYVGMQMTMTGNGFLPTHTVTITYTSSPIVVATAQTDASGDFSATFTIPPSEGGTHTIAATDGTNSLTETFYMESSAPTIPQPLLPEMGVKAKQPVYFDWADVADSSGVTYTLQIATDETFATVVLEKPDLLASEYTLTEEEKLETLDDQAPYYWRVKAIDGAYNASGWTGAGTFTVGGIFSNLFGNMPSLVHLWWGLGVAGAAIGGYFMGKRRAYYY